jgi:hypothetical protein
MSNEPNRAARRRRIVERVKSGETRKEIMQKEKISRVTLWSDLKALDSLFLSENSTEIKELKRRVGRALLESAENVLSGDLAPDMANAWRAIMSDFSELFGLNAPQKHLTARIDATTDQSKGMFVEFNRLVARKFQSWDKIVAFIRSCPDDPEDEPPYLLAEVVDEPTE